MMASDRERMRDALVWAHHLLVVLLVALRPLAWDGEVGALPVLIWWFLLAIGLALVAGETLAGARRGLRWGPAGVVAAAALVLLLPALRGPAQFVGIAGYGMLAGSLALAFYIAQIAAGRERLVVGALAAALAGEALMGLGQHFWSLPAMARELAGGGIDAVPPGMDGRFAERIANGGVFATFTLSNALAAFLLLVLVPLAAAVWRGGTGGARATVGAVVTAGAAVLALTNSKGAWLALAAAAALALVLHLRGWRRWATAGGLALLAAGAFALPAVQARLAASADVRLGYWQAAGRLVREHPLLGLGFGGYALEAPRALPLGGEYSRFVHSEPIEAAVAAGVLAGLAVLALLALLLLRAPRPSEPSPVPARQRLAPLVLVIAVPYLHVFGMLIFAGFPGSPDGFSLGWALLAGILMAGAGCAASGLPAVPAWAWHVALAALALHALQDFDLHAGGVTGTLAVVAALAGAQRTLALRGARRAIPLAVALAMLIALVWSTPRALALAAGREDVATVQLLLKARAQRDGELLRRAATVAANRLERPEQPLDVRVLEGLRDDLLARAWSALRRWPGGDAWMHADVLDLMTPGAHRLPLTTEAMVAFPASARIRALLSQDFAARGSWAEALAAARAAVERSPWYLPYRQDFVARLERAAAVLAEPALLAEAKAQRAFIAEHDPLVHVNDRARPEPSR